LAKASATKNAQKAVDNIQGEALRLEQAERSIKTMLKRVREETGEVEKAVEDLRKAEAEIDKDIILKLKRGGLPKQAALVGFLLFSVRSIIDTVISFSDESHLTVALIQGGIALVCAAYVFLI
jgi:ribosomal protein S20